MNSPYLLPIIAGAAGGVYTFLAIVLRWQKGEETIFTSAIALGGVAIALGLSSLDPSNPAEALPKVIEHLRDAVIVNVIGMFYKIVLSKFAKPILGRGGVEINFEPLLHQMAKNEAKADERSRQLSDDLRLNQEQMNANFSLLNRTLDGVLSELAKGATAEIIQALEGVIERFNQNLMEQFGENFKQLNEACLKLVTWQEQYGQWLDKLVDANLAIQESLEKSAQDFALTAQKTESFTQSAKDLEMLYENLTVHTERMGLMLERFKEVPVEASKSITQLAQIVASTQESLDKHNTAIAKKSEQFGIWFADQIGATENKMLTITGNAHENLQNSLTNAVADIGERLESSVSTIEEHVYQTQKAVHDNLNEALAKFAQIINDALIHSLQNSLHAANVADDVSSRVNDFEKRYGGER